MADVVENKVMDIAPVEDVVVDEYAESFNLLDSRNEKSAATWSALLSHDRVDEAAIKIKEKVIYRLARIFSQAKQYGEVMGLLRSNNELFSIIPKAKTAKIVRSIINIVSEEPDSLEIQASLCKDVIAWCKAEKRTFLRQRIEAKLANIFLERKELNEALTLVNSLLHELKKLDDKQMLTEVHLTESRIYHVYQNIPKSKSSLTASRTAANSIYVVPLLQAELDEMSGILHCEEGDNATAFSYFLEVRLLFHSTTPAFNSPKTAFFFRKTGIRSLRSCQ